MNPPFVEGAQAIDFNSDGLIDLYVGSRFYINQGNMKFVDRRADLGLSVISPKEEGAKFLDWNNDEMVDLVLLDPNFGPRMFEFNGDIFVEKFPFPPDNVYLNSFGIGISDLDGDGFQDILLAGGGSTVEPEKRLKPKLFIYRNGRYVNADFLPHNPNKWSDLFVLMDVDFNGSIDVFSRYQDYVFSKNIKLPDSYISVTAVDGSGRLNQYGRKVTVQIRGDISQKFTQFIDGGSGYLSASGYAVTFPLARSAEYVVNVYFASRVVSFFANSGSFVVSEDGNVYKH